MPEVFNSNLDELSDQEKQRFMELINKARINIEISEWDIEKVKNLIDSLFGAYIRLSIDSAELHEVFILVLRISLAFPEKLETTSLRFYLAGILNILSFFIPEESRDLSWVELITENKTAPILESIFLNESTESYIAIPPELESKIKELPENLRMFFSNSTNILSVTTLVQIVKEVISGYISSELDYHALELLQVVVLRLGRNTELSDLLLTQLVLLSNYIGGIVNISSSILRRKHSEDLKKNITKATNRKD